MSSAAAAEQRAGTCQDRITLENLPFDNVALRTLPIDPETRNYIRSSVPNSCFSRVAPEPVRNPKMVARSKAAMQLLGLDEDQLTREDAAEYFSGNKLLPGAEPASHCYCGHQFGTFAGQLGDGAAMYLGEVVNPQGERWEIQFKGAGPTPYSRRADGRKVLRSSVREFLGSEALHFLGIPTTRAGTLVTSDTMVMRDIFYNGNVIQERASIVLRLAPTFLRFGSFEIFKDTDPVTGRRGPSVGNTELLHRMLNYACDTFFQGVAGEHPARSRERYLAMYAEVVRSTAELVAKWQCVGFTHGVLNTDNMSLLGLTIDYGPYGFMEYFDPDYVPNGSDGTARYRYEAQPEICKWNLMKFGEAIGQALPLEASKPELEKYDHIYQRAYRENMRKKLGLTTERPEDDKLFTDLFNTMAATAADFTGLFRTLAEFDPSADPQAMASRLAGLCATPPTLAKAIRRKLRISKPSIPPQQLQMLWSLAQSQPDQLAAQWGAPKEAILEELQGEIRKLEASTEASQKAAVMDKTKPEDKRQQDEQRWGSWLGVYAQRLGQEEGVDTKQRRTLMDAANPSFVLRNWVAEEAIKQAEKGDYSGVQGVLQLLEKPFSAYGPGTSSGEIEKGVESLNDTDTLTGGPPPQADQLPVSPLHEKFLQPSPEWAADLICTCSS